VSISRNFPFAVGLTAIILFTLPAAAQSIKKRPRRAAQTGPAAASLVRPCVSKWSLSSEEAARLLADQNAVRNELGLPPLVWNAKLAETASEWACRGKAAHRIDSPYGENIFVASNPQIAIERVVAEWMTEKPYYNTATGDCRSDKTCNHYTQITWRRTSAVGCGINRSATGKWPVLVVCNYDPPGNTGGKAF